MTVLRLHRDLYQGAALGEALGVFAPHGTFERKDEPSHWVVESPERERRIAGELGNYALGLTAKGRKR